MFSLILTVIRSLRCALMPRRDLVLENWRRHLQTVLAAYLEYYHQARPYPALEGDCPVPRPVANDDLGEVVAMPMVGGLHHRYTRRAT